jgi:hypothetical protein
MGMGKVKVSCLPLVCHAAPSATARATATVAATATAMPTPDVYQRLLDAVTLDCDAFGRGDATSLWPLLTPRFQQQFNNSESAFAQSLQQHPGSQFVSCSMSRASLAVNGSSASASGVFRVMFTASGNTQDLTIQMTLMNVNGQWLLDTVQIHQ